VVGDEGINLRHQSACLSFETPRGARDTPANAAQHRHDGLHPPGQGFASNCNKLVRAPWKVNLLRQICIFIPEFLVPQLARETGVEKMVWPFSAWSHEDSRLHAPLTHSIGLNAFGGVQKACRDLATRIEVALLLVVTPNKQLLVKE
jgi:hypothetical protein